MADEADVLAVTRRTGGAFSEEEIEEALDVDGATVDGVVYSLLDAQLAILRANPTKLTIEGDRTEDWSGNIAALQAAVAAAAATAGVTPSGLSVTRLVRPSRER